METFEMIKQLREDRNFIQKEIANSIGINNGHFIQNND